MSTPRFYNTENDKRYTSNMLLNAGLSPDSPGICPLSYTVPAHDADLYCATDAGRVKQVWLDKFAVEYDIVPLPLDMAKENLKAKVTALRYERETGGLWLENGIKLHTTREARTAITEAVTRAQLKPKGSFDFKAADGEWRTVDAPTMKSIGMAVTDHVEACFTLERELYTAIDACNSVEELEALRIQNAWFPAPPPDTSDEAAGLVQPESVVEA